MSDKDDDLFGSDNEEGDDKKLESFETDERDEDVNVDEDEKVNTADHGKETSALFGSDDEDEVENDATEDDGEDGRSRFSSKQQDLDDLFGGNGESMFTSTPVITKKAATISKLCIPQRKALPDTSSCMAIKMPNFVKIAPVGFDPSKLDVEEESRIMGEQKVIILDSCCDRLYS